MSDDKYRHTPKIRTFEDDELCPRCGAEVPPGRFRELCRKCREEVNELRPPSPDPRFRVTEKQDGSRVVEWRGRLID